MSAIEDLAYASIVKGIVNIINSCIFQSFRLVFKSLKVILVISCMLVLKLLNHMQIKKCIKSCIY
jgi:hypothetical protein